MRKKRHPLNTRRKRSAIPPTMTWSWVRIGATFAAVLGCLVTLASVFQSAAGISKLLTDDPTTAVLALYVTCYIALLVTLGLLAFYRREPAQNSVRGRTVRSRRTSRRRSRSSHWRRAAQMTFILAAILPITSALYVTYWRKAPTSQLRLLVCTMQGPDQSNYQVTHDVFSALHDAFGAIDDVDIRLSPNTVTDPDGVQKARALGLASDARIVVWGRYGLVGDQERIELNVETLWHSPLENLPPSVRFDALVSSREIGHYELVAEKTTELVAATLCLGAIWKYEQADYPSAVELATRALVVPVDGGRVPNEPVLRRIRGSAYGFLEKPNEAIADLSLSLHSRPDDPLALNNRGVSYHQLGNYDEAVMDFTKATTCDPSYALGYINLSSAEEMRHQHSKAIAAISSAMSLKPDWHSLSVRRGLMLRQLGRYEESIADLGRVPRDHFSYPDALYFRGVCFLETRDLVRARADAEELSQLRPDDPAALCLLTDVLRELGDDWMAYETLRDGERRQASSVDGLVDKGLAFARLGRHSDALTCLDRALEARPFDVEVLIYQGLSRLSLGQCEQALASLSLAIDIRPDSPRAYLWRGIVKLRDGQYLEAVDDLQTAERQGLETPVYRTYKEVPEFRSGPTELSRKEAVLLRLRLGEAYIAAGEPRYGLLTINGVLGEFPGSDEHREATLVLGQLGRIVGWTGRYSVLDVVEAMKGHEEQVSSEVVRLWNARHDEFGHSGLRDRRYLLSP